MNKHLDTALGYAEDLFFICLCGTIVTVGSVALIAIAKLAPWLYIPIAIIVIIVVTHYRRPSVRLKRAIKKELKAAIKAKLDVMEAEAEAKVKMRQAAEGKETRQ
jgi:Flp pilus assembly protein TadB